MWKIKGEGEFRITQTSVETFTVLTHVEAGFEFKRGKKLKEGKGK